MHEDYITDSTNLDNDYTRNKLRNVLIPYIEANMNQNVVGRVCDMAESVSQAEDYVSRQAKKLHDACVTYDVVNSSSNTGEKIIIQQVRNVCAHVSINAILEADSVIANYVIRIVIGNLADLH